ncbi:hypothetical protein ID866_1776 [Astraeus odoratus]|nr:hypothetical protein ID866_1776 [Astraeus odoratus]
MMASSPSEGSELEFAFPSCDVYEPEESKSQCSGELVDGEWTKLYHQNSLRSYSRSSNNLASTDVQLELAPHQRASPMPTSIRFSQQTTAHREQPSKSILDSWLSRRSSVHSASTASHAAHTNVNPHGHTRGANSKLKGKERSLESAESSPVVFGYGQSYGSDADHLTSSISNPSASFTSHESSSRIVPILPHPQGAAPQPRKQRASLLVAATDVLGLRKKLGSVSRKKPHHISNPNCIPDVIEISAHSDTYVTTTTVGSSAHMDKEHEERERLRDAAAQSLGIDPDLSHQPRKSQSLSSINLPEQHDLRPRQPRCIPAFPATLGALSPLTQMSATLPKFTPATSLLVYALAKQWKPRTIVLTSHVASHKIHVHLFKSASPGEVEMERLEITEDSAMFVADEEVGGRRSVIKLAGKGIGRKKSNNNTGSSAEDAARTMWFLQMTDTAESQRWIAAIKNAVLNQRSVRAGLGIPAPNGAYGPKGDMDVMLSMRMQGMISPQPSKKVSLPPSSTYASSPSPPQSLRSLAVTIPSLPPANGFKNMFTGARSRSPSLDTSHSPLTPHSHAEESFGVVGTSLLTMFRGNTSSDGSASPSYSLPLPLPHIPRQGSPAASVRSASTTVVIPASDLKISKDRDIPEPPSSSPIICTSPGTITPPAAFHATPPKSVPLPLQPPPRKPRNISTAPLAPKQGRDGFYKQTEGNGSVAGSFGIQPADGQENFTVPPTPSLGVVHPDANVPWDPSEVESRSTTSPDGNQQPMSPLISVTRALSTDSVSGSIGNGTLGVPTDPESRSRTSSTSKRGSRLIGSLPQRLAPPAGPPPSVPDVKFETPPPLHLHVPHPYAGDGPPSSPSSNSRTDMSPNSTSSQSPNFWKRTSSSSAYSVDSWSTSDSRVAAEPTPMLGSLVSPSTPAVTTGPPARSMSLTVTGTSSVASKVKRRSMPPPRPAPTHAPPPAPVTEPAAILPLQGPASPPATPPQAQKSLRASVAQRALRLSLTLPKPPPASGLPPRPDESGLVRGHRRSTSSSTIEGMRPSTELPSIPGSPPRSPSRTSVSDRPRPPSSASSTPSLSIRQRLRILSTPSPSLPSTSLPPIQTQFPVETQSQAHVPPPHAQVSTLDLDDDDPSTPSHAQAPRPTFGIGEHIMDIRDDPNFLSLSVPDSPTVPRPPPRSPFRPLPMYSTGLGSPVPEGDFEFMSLSPPPPRRGSRQISVMVVQPEKDPESDLPAFSETVSPNPDPNGLAALSARGSVVSLGFITM